MDEIQFLVEAVTMYNYEDCNPGHHRYTESTIIGRFDTLIEANDWMLSQRIHCPDDEFMFCRIIKPSWFLAGEQEIVRVNNIWDNKEIPF